MSVKTSKYIEDENGDLYQMIPPAATESEFGGIKAAAKPEGPTGLAEVVMDTTGKAYANLSGIVSDAWDSSVTYDVGDYVIYDNTFWKCLVANTGQTPQEGTYWTKTSTKKEFSELNSNLEQNTYGKFELKNGLKMYWGKKYSSPASTQNGSYYNSTTSMTDDYPSGFTPQILLAFPDSGNSDINVDLRAQTVNKIFYKTSQKGHEILFYWLAIGY